MAEAFCLASGPSLTQDDVELVRQWRDGNHLRKVIVANTTFRISPWADALFAMDRAWWKAYAPELECFAGDRYSISQQDAKLNVIALTRGSGFSAFGNSGAAAASLAIHLGCTTIYLLGYDAKMNGSRTHWHGDHPKGLSNARSIPRWGVQFKMLARYAKSRGVSIVNCTHDTALTCFDRMLLEDVI